MIGLSRSELERSSDAFLFDAREVFKNLFTARTCGKHFEYVSNANPHAADRWPSAILLRVEGDAVKFSRRIYL